MSFRSASNRTSRTRISLPNRCIACTISHKPSHHLFFLAAAQSCTSSLRLNYLSHTSAQLLEFWELCEHAQCTQYMILRYIPYLYCFSEHFASIPFYFVVYSIYTRACTVVSYPFASVTYRDNRNITPFSHLDHADNLRLLIRFQHQLAFLTLHLINTPLTDLTSVSDCTILAHINELYASWIHLHKVNSHTSTRTMCLVAFIITSI